MITKFDELLAPIETLTTIVFSEYVEDNLKHQCNTYKEELFTSKNSLEELNTLIKLAVIKILSLLSEKYKQELFSYYNQSGIDLYIYSSIKAMVYKNIDENGLCVPRRRI